MQECTQSDRRLPSKSLDSAISTTDLTRKFGGNVVVAAVFCLAANVMFQGVVVWLGLRLINPERVAVSSP